MKDLLELMRKSGVRYEKSIENIVQDYRHIVWRVIYDLYVESGYEACGIHLYLAQ